MRSRDSNRYAILQHIYAWLLCVLFATGCTQVTEGIEVTIAYQAPPTPNYMPADNGYRIHLQTGFISFDRVELIACESNQNAATEFLSRVGSILRAASAKRARAHAPTTPTQLGVPTVFDLAHNTGAPIVGGVLRPPPGSYCGIRLVCASPDMDATGLPPNVEPSAIHAITVKGMAEHTETQSQTPIVIEVTDLQIDHIPFVEPLELGSNDLDATVVVLVDHLRWFDSLDFEHMSQQRLEQQVMTNIERSFKTNFGL